MNTDGQALNEHFKWQGKIEVVPRIKISSNEDLSVAYTPGVAAPCLEIERDYSKSWELTRRGNLVAVITNGSAVLGLGNIGAAAGMPVMEGKCVLFKQFADIDAFPICIDSDNTDEIVRVVGAISKSFGGINLEDIAAPACFEIERRLKKICDIPVFHDDQHGTATVTAAAVINSAKLTGKELSRLKIIINGAGSAGTAIAKLLIKLGVSDITLANRKGLLVSGDSSLSAEQQDLAKITNPDRLSGTLANGMKNADVFIGVSAPNTVSREMVESMAEKPIVFAMANPIPEILPDDAKAGGAYIVGTGRSDYPNQINNLLAFPGIFKGALAVRATDITVGMEIAAAKAIASFLPGSKLCPECVIPNALSEGIAEAVANAVADAAVKDGVARKQTK